MPRVAGPQLELCQRLPSFWVLNGTMSRKIGLSILRSTAPLAGRAWVTGLAVGPGAMVCAATGVMATTRSAPAATMRDRAKRRAYTASVYARDDRRDCSLRARCAA